MNGILNQEPMKVEVEKKQQPTKQTVPFLQIHKDFSLKKKNTGTHNTTSLLVHKIHTKGLAYFSTSLLVFALLCHSRALVLQ